MDMQKETVKQRIVNLLEAIAAGKIEAAGIEKGNPKSLLTARF